MSLAGKNAAITGGSQGLGLAVTREFVRQGASVAICGRHRADLENAAQSLMGDGPGRVAYAVADVSRESDVDAFAAFCERELGGTDALVCNAGVYGPKGSLEEIDWQAWRQAIDINLMGAAYCCRAFLPQLVRSGRGKIILMSGGGATKPLPYLSAYAASKAALVRFGETLAEELKPKRIDVNMVAPGALNTRLLDEVIEAGPERVGAAFYEASLKQKQNGGTPLDRGAALCAYLAGRESDGITGRLISAVWDPWERLHEVAEGLSATDIYTLRRIVPEDRGKAWN
jgi:NAD(P)-dependent dehydrogenase (short-subunit alcohol dehydrogenase family)